MSIIDKSTAKAKEEEGSSLVERASGKISDASANDQAATPKKAQDAPKIKSKGRKAAKPTPSNDTGTRHSKRAVIDLERLRSANILTPDSDPGQTFEEFRIVKRQLLNNAFGVGDKAIKNGNLMLVTSAEPGEGKTFCAINLAMSIASEQDLTVLLVDADVSKPDVLSSLGVQGGKGLMDIIADDSVDVADCLLKTNIENLTLLPAGRAHKLSTELMASERMGRFVKEIAQRYPDRVIIFDSAPALASSVPGVLAMHVGQVLFIVEAERTRESQAKEALSMLSSCKYISLLLNKARFTSGIKRFGSYEGYGYP
jgi:receptor protein-tyrosine kinase